MRYLQKPASDIPNLSAVYDPKATSYWTDQLDLFLTEIEFKRLFKNKLHKLLSKLTAGVVIEQNNGTINIQNGSKAFSMNYYSSSCFAVSQKKTAQYASN